MNSEETANCQTGWGGGRAEPKQETRPTTAGSRGSQGFSPVVPPVAVACLFRDQVINSREGEASLLLSNHPGDTVHDSCLTHDKAARFLHYMNTSCHFSGMCYLA